MVFKSRNEIREHQKKGEVTKSSYNQSITIITTKPGSQEMNTNATINFIQKRLDNGKIKSSHVDTHKKLIRRIQSAESKVKTHKVEIKK